MKSLYEVADPVQADSYSIDSVAISDFVTPLYFARLAGNIDTQTDYLNTALLALASRAASERTLRSDCSGPGALEGSATRGDCGYVEVT